MEYVPAKSEDIINVRDIVTMHYPEFDGIDGEKCNFWELLYVENGNVRIFTDEEDFCIESGNIFLNKPNGRYKIEQNGEISSDIAIIRFFSDSAAMEFFGEKPLKTGLRQRELVSGIIRENRMHLIGAGQLIKLYLCELLISLMRAETGNAYREAGVNAPRALVNEVSAYLDSNFMKKIKIDDLVKRFNTNKSALETAFRNTVGTGVIGHLIKIRVEYAKQYIKAGEYNLTQIAELLGYEGLHYFSRQFKQIVGMTPTEFSKSAASAN